MSTIDDARHPLLTMLVAAHKGGFPRVDGLVEFAPRPSPDVSAVMSFTGHTIIATNMAEADFVEFELDGFGSALQPAVLEMLAGANGAIGTVDATLVATGVGGGRLCERTDLDGHRRVLHARGLRNEVRVYGDARGLLTLSRGLAGRTEISVETEPELAGTGAGRSLVRDGLGLAVAGEPIFAAVSPGNARSLRAFLSVGFVPLGSEVLIKHE